MVDNEGICSGNMLAQLVNLPIKVHNPIHMGLGTSANVDCQKSPPMKSCHYLRETENQGQVDSTEQRKWKRKRKSETEIGNMEKNYL